MKILLNYKVSIIVPVYNAEKYLAECIESLIKQTYPYLEILLINDGSKDNSLNICNEYAAIDNRIKVISQQNQGVSAARNNGIKIATGEYVCFVDSDDWLHIEAIEILLTTISKYNLELLIYNFKYQPIDNDVDENKAAIVEYVKRIEILEATLSGKWNNKDFAAGIWTKFYKRSLLIQHHLILDTEISIGEDLLFSVQSILAAERIGFIDFKAYNYRIVEDGVTRSLFKESDLSVLKAHSKIDELLLGYNIKLDSIMKSRNVFVLIWLILKMQHDSVAKKKYLKQLRGALKKDYYYFIADRFRDKRLKVIATLILLSPNLAYKLRGK